MKKMYLSFIAVAIAVIFPIVVFSAICLFTPSQYEETFLGELSEKYGRLKEIDEEKVILIGGSSLAFGIDSQTMEEYLKRPVVNFGLYATLGTKVMLDLSKSEINRGDIVVICPEMDTQTLSLYFNAESMWQAVDSDISLLFGMGLSNMGDMAGGFWNYLSSKLDYANGEGLNVSGVYTKAAFNEYGDIVYERPYNQMTLGYDPNKIIELSSEIFDSEFIDYVNSYVSWARLRGAEVYFSFPPMNRLAVAETDDDGIHEFYQFISDSLDCEIISDVNDYILDEGYFYDSNFHLNDAGVPIRTMQLVEDIRRAVGDTEAVEIVYPEIPEVPVSEDPEENGGKYETLDFTETPSEYFTYEKFGNGLAVTGVTDEGSSLETVVIPKKHDGTAILAIEKGAFSNVTALKTLVIYDNIVQLYDGFLSGCNVLEDVYIYNDSCTSISIGSGLLDGVKGKPTIRVPIEVFGTYAADYFWGIYAGNLSVIGAD